VFISYRRDDAAADANAIARLIKERVGEDEVFFDTSSIAPGQSWPDRLKDEVLGAKYVIAVIGPEWVRMAD
jgi:hypothetical protein